MTATYAKTYTSMSGERRTLRVSVSAAPRTVITKRAGFLRADSLPDRSTAFFPRLRARRIGWQLKRDGYTRVA